MDGTGERTSITGGGSEERTESGSHEQSAVSQGVDSSTPTLRNENPDADGFWLDNGRGTD